MRSKLPPHNAARRVACPGSRFLEEKYNNDEPSSFAKQGEAAHWIAGTTLSLGHIPLNSTRFKSPKGEPITQDMIDGAGLYLSAIEIVTNQDNCPPLIIERPLDISAIHLDCWGIPDAWVVHNEHLFIWEYKYSHTYVEVYENWQMLEYAAGIADLESFDKVTFCVVQPRNFHPDGQIRYWTITDTELNEYIKKLQNFERLASQDNAKCTPTPQCNHCTARRACSTLQAASLEAVEISKQNTSFELTPVQVGKELKLLKYYAFLLESRITGLEEQTKHLIQKGERVPGYKMQSVSNREVWTKSPEEVVSLGLLLGVDLSKTQTTVTPSQARKLGIEEEILSAYTERQKGALKLVEENIVEAKKIFGVKT